MTVRVDIKHTCGCGFSTRDIDKAVTHCNETSHSITVHGSLTIEKEHTPVKSTRTRAAASSEKTTTKEFDTLRKKLAGG